MFKISVHFKSNIKGVYTHEEEIATDIIQLSWKYQRMLDRWFNILCPHINFSSFFNQLHLEKINDIEKRIDKIIINQFKIQLINEMLDYMDDIDEEISGEETTPDNMRKFEIKIEEI
jgi:hypothetical protein